jgi:hypothetical protein
MWLKSSKEKRTCLVLHRLGEFVFDKTIQMKSSHKEGPPLWPNNAQVDKTMIKDLHEPIQ